MSTRGRVDILLDSMAEQYAKSQPNPIFEAAFNHFRPAIREVLTDAVGPKTTVGKRTRKALDEGQKFHEQLTKAKTRRAIR